MSDYHDTPFSEEPDAVAESTGDDNHPRYRASRADPLFGFLLALALSVGLIPMLPENADLRYTLAWGALAGVGVLGWLLGNADRIEQERPENLGWGVAFGAMLSVPFVIFFPGIFGSASALIFPDLGTGTVLAYLVFVMPLAETLFFRGSIQRNLDFWIVGALSSLWSVLLFFPVMWNMILDFAFVALFLVVALFAVNMLYSYVRDRNGLAAAWICQITINLVLFFFPYL